MVPLVCFIPNLVVSLNNIFTDGYTVRQNYFDNLLWYFWTSATDLKWLRFRCVVLDLSAGNDFPCLKHPMHTIAWYKPNTLVSHKHTQPFVVIQICAFHLLGGRLYLYEVSVYEHQLDLHLSAHSC